MHFWYDLVGGVVNGGEERIWSEDEAAQSGNKSWTKADWTQVSSGDNPFARSTCFQQQSLQHVQSKVVQGALVVLYTSTALLALLGNLLVIGVQMLGSKRRSKSNIRRYLINLAVSDLLIGVACVPFTYVNIALGHWVFPRWLCPTTQVVQLWSVFVTAATLTIIGVERYTAALHPFTPAFDWFQSHTGALLVVSWITGLLYALVPLQHTYTERFRHQNVTYLECKFDNQLSLLKRRILVACNFALTFAIPAVVLTLAYVAILRTLWSANRANQQLGLTSYARSVTASKTSSSNHGILVFSTRNATTGTGQVLQMAEMSERATCPPAHLGAGPTANSEIGKKAVVTSGRRCTLGLVAHQRNRTIRMIFVVVLLYGVCWAPIKVMQLGTNYGFLWYCSEREYHIYVAAYIAAHWLAMANSCVNPIVYSFMSQSFRVRLDCETRTN